MPVVEDEQKKIEQSFNELDKGISRASYVTLVLFKYFILF